jgi:hypothetical protein
MATNDSFSQTGIVVATDEQRADNMGVLVNLIFLDFCDLCGVGEVGQR